MLVKNTSNEKHTITVIKTENGNATTTTTEVGSKAEAIAYCKGLTDSGIECKVVDINNRTTDTFIKK
jgi:hypothetical protein